VEPEPCRLQPLSLLHTFSPLFKQTGITEDERLKGERYQFLKGVWSRYSDISEVWHFNCIAFSLYLLLRVFLDMYLMRTKPDNNFVLFLDYNTLGQLRF
jgi:hypothetical protein